MRSAGIVFFVFISLCQDLAAQAPAHVRVILDTSKSMDTNDPPRLAVLSTQLLFDLVGPSLGPSGTFRVIPFHETFKWTNTASPPTSTGVAIDPGPLGRREDFVQKMAAVQYTANWTYFYPGLNEAISELESAPGGDDARRVIVLVTDGLPEAPTRDEELSLIQSDLHPRLVNLTKTIQLYVLAFGPIASQAPNHSFFRSIVEPQGRSVGEVFIDPDGSALLDNMIKIFNQSFGYVSETTSGNKLNLEGGVSPQRVAAVSLWKPRIPVPAFNLTSAGAPVGMNNPSGLLAGQQSGASYAVRWILKPPPGFVDFTAMGKPYTVAVLRPSEIQLEIRASKPGSSTTKVMARSEMKLKVLVKPIGGAKGDPGEFNIAYTLFGWDPLESTCRHASLSIL